MPATFTGTKTDVRLGPCRVKFNSVDLGITLGGVKVSMTPSFADLKGDQYGETAIDSVLTGQSYTVELALAEVANKANIMKAIPYAVQTGTGATSKVEVSNATGTAMSQFADTLELHPMNKADADKSEDILFQLAYVTSALELEYGSSNQRSLKLTFKCIPDDDGLYVTFGDPAATGA